MMRLCLAAAALAALAAASGAGATDLLTAYQQALKADAVYLAAKAGSAADRQEVPKALAGLLPNLSLSGSDTRNDSTIQSHNAAGTISVTRAQDYPSYSQAWFLRQPLFRMQNYYAYGQAEAVARRADATEEKERQGLGVRIAEAYFETLLSLENERLVRTQKASYDRILELAQRAFEGGAGTRIDVLDIRSRRDLATALEIEAANTVRNNLRTIQSITQVPPGRLNPLDAARLELRPPPIPLARWEEIAVASNPEIETARQEVESAEKEIEKQRSGHYPTLDIVATRKRSSNETESTLNQNIHTDYLGLQFSVPIYAGGAVVASVRQAASRAEQARQKMDAVRNDVLLRVNKEFANLEQASLKSAALVQAVISGEESAKASAMGIIAGTRTAIDALNAQDQLLRSRVELAKTRFLYVLSYLRLHAAAGVLSDDKFEIANAWLERDSP